MKPGTQVRFSRHVRNGSWQQWTLIFDDFKYELCKAKQEVATTTLLLDHERRDAANDTALFPEYNGHYIVLVGWTPKPREEIDEISQYIVNGLPKAVPTGTMS